MLGTLRKMKLSRIKVRTCTSKLPLIRLSGE